MINANVQPLVTLLQTCESILFSFKLSNGVYQKYEGLRKKTFEKCGVSYVPIQKHVQVLYCTSETQTEVVENDSWNGFLSVNLDIISNILSKLHKVCESLSVISGKTAEPDTPKKQSLLEKSPIDTLKSLLSRQILTIDSTLNSAISHVQIISVKITNQSLCHSEQESSLRTKLMDAEDELKRLKDEHEQTTQSFKTTLDRERKKLIEQEHSFEHIVSLQEKQIGALSQEIQVLKKKSQEFDRKKLVLEDEVIFANDEKLRAIDETREKYKTDIELLIRDKQALEQGLKEEIQRLKSKFDAIAVERTKEKEQELRERAKKESQFFKHLEKLNEDFVANKKTIKDLEEKCYHLDEMKATIFKEISKTLQYFTGKPLTVESEEDEESVIIQNLGQIKKAIEKLTVENNWLVDQLRVYEESNRTLRTTLNSTLTQELDKEASKTSTTFKEFEKSRVKFKQFFDRKKLN